MGKAKTADGGNKGGGENRGGGQRDQQRQNEQPRMQQQQRNERPQAQREQRQEQVRPQRNERPQAQREPQRQEQRYERPQIQRGQQRQEQRYERPQAQREPQRQEQRYERPQTQREPQRIPQGWQKQEQRQQNGRNEQRRQEVRQIPDWSGYEPQRNNGEVRRQRRNEGDGQRQDRQRQIPWSNAWPNNYGYQRSNEVHARNAERKAWRFEEKALRSNLRRNRSYAYGYQTDPYYWDNGYVNQYPHHARANILRNLIASVLGSNSGYDNNYYSQAQPVYYGDPYYSANYNGNYYNGYSPYRSYAAVPYYVNYQPYGYGYDPQYDYDPYYSDNYYSDVSFSNYSNPANGGDFVQQLFSKLLALGYDQGYNEGLNARRAGFGDRYYSDPYDYGDTNYISYSNSLGENRRCLSDGYELGYNDALYNQRGSDPYQNNTDVDLVSLLIGSVFQNMIGS